MFSVMANATCDSVRSDSDSQKPDLNVQNSAGNTPIHQIVAIQNPRVIQKLEEKDIQNLELLLKYNPDINLQNVQGYTSVHLAIQNKRSDALVQVFFDQTAECDYSFTDQEGCSALYHAVSPISFEFDGWSNEYSQFNFKFRDVSIIKHLVEKGAKVDIAANDGYSPLLLAVVMRNTDYVKVMLARYDSQGGLEQTVSTYFCDGLQHNAPKRFYYPPEKYYGMTPLLVSIYDNNKAMAEILVKAGANVNVVNKNGDNGLHMITKGDISPEKQGATDQT